MKILIFEYITGGGLSQVALPQSLAKEGELMLKALVNELLDVPDIQLTVLLDWRFKEMELTEQVEIVWVSSQQNVYDLLPALINVSDFVWPIAPEMESILLNISKCVEHNEKRLLNSSSVAVALCSDKLLTYQVLKNHGINRVETTQFDLFSDNRSDKWVVKPKDGVSCINSYLVTSYGEFVQLEKQIEDKTDYVIQPYLIGDTLSLSCLFKEGNAWVLCCNRQEVSINQGQFELNACVVNISVEKAQAAEAYQSLIENIARAIPDLWGYVGIDIIQPKGGPPLVLEINPRLTTSYVGIHHALGFNIARTVFEMVTGEPEIIPTTNKQIIINVT